MSYIENEDKIIIIQKYVRRFLIKKNILLPSSYYQTKNWRKQREWYMNGKANECEKYQIYYIQKIIMESITKTNDRINMETIEIINKRMPNVYNDGFEWSENFDGKIIKNNNTYYFNLKFVCDSGGGQTRTLREVYHFIKYQMKYLLKYKSKNIYFINILDGNTSHNNMDKYKYLYDKPKYKNIIKYMFIGDLYSFQKYINAFKNR
jgi:hypothetical protein